MWEWAVQHANRILNSCWDSRPDKFAEVDKGYLREVVICFMKNSILSKNEGNPILLLKNDGNSIWLQERACMETKCPKKKTNMWADRTGQN